jgi:hypothetical protein
MKKSHLLALPTSILSLLLVACGGGGGGDNGGSGSGGGGSTQTTPPPSTAEGVYGGTLAGSIGSAFEALILENGEFWSIYGQDSGSFFNVYGFVQGKGSSANGTSFTASDVKDFGFVPPLSGNLTATYNSTAKTISGTIATGSGSVTFSGGPIAGSLYDYNSAATLSAVTGQWAVGSSLGGTMSVNVTASGAVTTSQGGCTSSGSITPRPSGKNVFNITLTNGPAPCAAPNQTMTGIAIVYPLGNGQTQLIAAVVDSARVTGIAVFGIR